jgi:hypothetical protein
MTASLKKTQKAHASVTVIRNITTAETLATTAEQRQQHPERQQ